MVRKTIIFAAILGLAFSCRKPAPVVDPDEFDRTGLLTNLADNFIVPAYLELQNKVNTLQTEANEFSTTPNTFNLGELRAAWKEALTAWQAPSLLEIGPGASIGQRVQINIYPTDTTLINTNIQNGGYNLEAAGNLPAKGFQAIDFIIHGYGLNDSQLIDLFTSDGQASARKQYLSDLVTNLKMHVDNVAGQWSSSYRDAFVANSADNSVGSSIGLLINAYVMHFEAHVRKGKVGLPSGIFNGFSQLPMPDHVEAFYAQESLPHLIRALEAAKKIFEGSQYNGGANGSGFDDYLNYVDAKLDGQNLSVVISNQFDVAITKAQTFADPFADQMTTNQTKVFELYDELQKLVAYLKTDMVSELGVQITYVDNDGD